VTLKYLRSRSCINMGSRYKSLVIQFMNIADGGKLSTGPRLRSRGSLGKNPKNNMEHVEVLDSCDMARTGR
jgi:hypothetical protein